VDGPRAGDLPGVREKEEQAGENTFVIGLTVNG
jgi:hypothetical protein